MMLQSLCPSLEICHSHVSPEIGASSSFSVAVSAVPAEGGSAENVIVPGSSTSVTVMVTVMVSSVTGVSSAVPASSLLSVTWTMTVIAGVSPHS